MNDFSVRKRLRKSEINFIIIMLKVNLKHHRIVIKRSSLYTCFVLTRLVEERHHGVCWIAIRAKSSRVLRFKFILIRIRSCCNNIFLSSLNGCFHIMYVLRDGFPTWVWFLRQDMNSHQILFLRRFRKVLDFEQIPPSWLSIPHSKVKPLLMAFCVSINLHV